MSIIPEPKEPPKQIVLDPYRDYPDPPARSIGKPPRRNSITRKQDKKKLFDRKCYDYSKNEEESK